MRDRQTPWLLAVILTVLGVKYVSGPSRENEPEPRAVATAAGERRPAAGDSHGPEARGEAVAGGEGGFESLLMTPGGEVQEYLIATLPDPFESSSGYQFDNMVDAIQRAAETQSYVLEHYYYPWKMEFSLPGAEEKADPAR
jgi:hypothetical protein